MGIDPCEVYYKSDKEVERKNIDTHTHTRLSPREDEHPIHHLRSHVV